MQHESTDIYERITQQILQAIEDGAVRFRMPWHVTGADCFLPINAVSKRPYRGINVLALWATAGCRGYQSGLWATYNQWQELGGQVRKGEKAAPVVFWKISERKSGAAQEGEEPEERTSGQAVLAKGYTVFNVAQVEGYIPPAQPVLPESERLPEAERFFVGLGADVRHGGAVACYLPDADLVQMPPFASFREAAGYYSTLAHEATHWAGAPHRLNRDLRSRFGSESYALEEFVAELGAAFLCAALGISNVPRPEHAAYLATWIAVLRRDRRAVFTAAAQAQKAIDWMSLQSAEQTKAA